MEKLTFSGGSSTGCQEREGNDLQDERPSRIETEEAP